MPPEFKLKACGKHSFLPSIRSVLSNASDVLRIRDQLQIAGWLVHVPRKVSKQMSRLATVAQAAKKIGLEPSTFRYLADCGRLPGPKPELDGKVDMKAVHVALDRMSGLDAREGGRIGNAFDAWKASRG